MKAWLCGVNHPDQHMPDDVKPNDKVSYMLIGSLKIHHERAGDVCWPEVDYYEVASDEQHD